MPKRRLIIVILLGLSFLLGCVPPRPTEPVGPAMVRVDPADWPDLTDDLDPDSLATALEASRTYLRRLPPDRTFQYGKDVYTAAHLLESLDVFGTIYRTIAQGTSLKDVLRNHFILYRSVGDEVGGRVLCTGYYEPLLHGSLKPGGPYRWPLYGRPADLIDVDLGAFSKELNGQSLRGRIEGNRLIPYHTRKQIDREAALDGRGLELVWVDDPVDLFFLHIQGSGRVALEDGQIFQVGYAGANGRPYRSIGALMIERGLVGRDDMSMQAIKAWLRGHPDETTLILEENESYIFFRILENGPLGNINVPLTPGRSAALDHRIFPRGALAWISSRRPVTLDGQVTGWRNFSRFVLVQDTGGAIRGPGRLDLFFGHGPDAEAAAGRMKEKGDLFFPVLKIRQSGS